MALGTEAARRYPELVDALLRRDACFMAHGDYATRRITSRSPDRRGLGSSPPVTVIVAAVGEGSKRLVRAGLQRVRRTPRALLAEAGFHYLGPFELF